MGVGQRVVVVALIVLGISAGALALWHLRLIVFLFLLGITWAAAMRPGVERLSSKGVPRPVGVLLHFAAVAAVLGLVLWLAVPRAIHQIQDATGGLPTSQSELHNAARSSSGFKHALLVDLEHALDSLPSGDELLHPAFSLTKKALEILFAIFFTLATAAYWSSERERAQRILLHTVPRDRRRVVRATWDLVDLKLGAYVRGQLLTITFVGATLSAAFWLIGLPFWLLLGVFAGLVEVVPVVGPLAAGVLAVGVGLTVDWKHALYAGIAVWGLRLLQDYVINPRVFGHAVGLSPLVLLLMVSAVGLLLGGVYVLISVPLASVAATVVDVAVLSRDPEEQDPPAVLFSRKDGEP
jgi:predicted PurR-regulated permease PerM